jgi:hypothetical protein
VCEVTRHGTVSEQRDSNTLLTRFDGPRPRSLKDMTKTKNVKNPDHKNLTLSEFLMDQIENITFSFLSYGLLMYKAIFIWYLL